ncbi:MAG: hypothetical protein WHU94_04935 [Thermogemmata sp.]|uniref:ABC transporter permease n=1 Tax=Thermogemmata fonticola TaxID=2755323 RepID=A0A7V9ABQ5_9BACT|nr:hypothetical protein [Thermogemmata fonticola]MBA2226323.1 hypothetical protein [Thermogemmata fonticola]MCX8139994.1 hypothetical protein [Gemmataceae bacterium]
MLQDNTVSFTFKYRNIVLSWFYLIWFILAGQLRRNSLTLWVSTILSGVVVLWVSIETQRDRWDLRQRRIARAGPTYGQILDRAIMEQAYAVLSSQFPAGTAGAVPLLIPSTLLRLNQIQSHLGFMHYSYWIMYGVYLGFLMPLLTLSCVNTLIDPENDAWVWLWSRPLPRSSIYLAQWIGTLPWIFLLNFGVLTALALAGGTYGRRSLFLYSLSIMLGIFALASLFHFFHILFRRPVVIGLIYVFFFESLVGNLPGSVKLLSLTFHIRSLMYRAAQAEGYQVELLLFPEAATWEAAVGFLLFVTVLLTLLGAWLSSYRERREII